MSDNKQDPGYAARQRIINSAFGWLKDVSTMTVDGKVMMVNKGDNKPYNVADVMYEDEFKATWLMQFALGRVADGLNFFDTDSWIELSGNGLQSVMIIDASNKPMFLIPPLTTNNMGPEHRKILADLEKAIKMIIADEQSNSNPDSTAHLAHGVEDSLVNVKPFTFTDMVPAWYYEKQGLIPEVEKQIYYIMKVVNPAVTHEQLDRVRPILYDIYREKVIKPEDKKFIIDITKGEFTFVDVSPTAVNKAVEEDNEPDPDFDPLEC